MENNQTIDSTPVNLRPLGARVLVRQKSWQEKKGSLYIPHGHREGFEERAVVLAVGPKVTVDVKVGDLVIFKRQPAASVNPDPRLGDPNNEKDLLMLKEENLLAVIEGD